MLPKKYRLTVGEFTQNTDRINKLASSIINILIKPGETSFPRFTVAVPKSLDKRSVFRHLTKRIILEAAGRQIKKIRKPIDCLIKPNKIFLRKDSLLIKGEIYKLFQKAGLI